MAITMFFIFFYVFSIGACCPEQLVCAKSFNSLNRTFEATNCFIPKNSLNLIFECELLNNLKRSDNKHHKVIRSTLKFFKNETIRINYTGSITWNVTRNKENIYDSLTRRSNDHQPNDIDPITELIIYNIEEGNKYRICTRPSLTNNEDICCEIFKENNSHEEQSHYMHIIVAAVLIMIYVIVVVVHKTCPPSSYRSLDELLEKLPSYHVDALKELVYDREIIDEEETNKVTQNTDIKYVRHRYVKKKKTPDEHLIYQTNLAFENEAYGSVTDCQKMVFQQNNLDDRKPRSISASDVLLNPPKEKSKKISIIQVNDDEQQLKMQTTVNKFRRERDKRILTKPFTKN